jgi:hypothetical protein
VKAGLAQGLMWLRLSSTTKRGEGDQQKWRINPMQNVLNAPA